MNTKVKKTNSRNKTKKKNQSRNKQTKKKQSKKIQSKKIQSKTKQSKIGGFFFTPTNTGISSQIKKSVITENNLINSYEKMSNSISDYYDKYDNHLRNLISIDDFANFDSMEKLFKDEIINKHFKDSKKIDKSNPLLLRNYLVDGISTPSSFRKEHLIKQIRYKLYYNFSDRERQLIIDVNIKLVDNESIAMIIRTIENKVYKKSIQHKNYNLDLSQVEESLANIIKETKESLGYKNNILKQKPKNNNTKNNSNNFEFQNNVVENSDLIFRNNNNKNNNNKNNNNNEVSMLKLIDEDNNNNKNVSGAPINIFAELENKKQNNKKQEISKDQPDFDVPENLKEKLIIGQPTQPDMGMGMQPGMGIQPGMGMQPRMGMQPGMGMQPSIGMQPGMGMPTNVRNNVEKKCQDINRIMDVRAREQSCRNTPDCFYNIGKQSCHKDMKR